MPLRLSAEQYFKILDSLPDHVFIFSADGEYLHVFGGADNQVGSDCKQFVGLTLYDAMPSEMAALFHDYIKATLEANQTQRVEYHFDKEQMQGLPFESHGYESLWIEGILKPFYMDNGEQVVIWSAKNITEKHYLQMKLQKLSEIDSLTGVFNRRAFLNHVCDELDTNNGDSTLMMFDIDWFKHINDRYGHLSGDAIILHIIELICHELQKISQAQIIGRLGGDEFVLLLSNLNGQQGKAFAERVRNKVDTIPYQVDKQSIHVTISIGISQFASGENNYKGVLSRADKAMYYSKHNGRNRVTLYEEVFRSL